jgi:Ca-activated chloride channel homolog
MSLLAPVGLLFSLLAIPILLMYMLKLRRREVRVSSVMLWQLLLRDRQANAPWQRIKRNWLLFLQLLILTLLTAAIARPALEVPRVASGSMIVLLDASASMAATDVNPNRFEAARNIARDLIASMESSARMTMIQVGYQPKVLAASENDKSVLNQKLLEASVTQDIANWNTAFALAAGAVASMQDDTNTIVIISDGGIPSANLPPLPAELRYVPIGESGENIAISALAVRPAGTANELFASLTNYSNLDKPALLSIYLNGKLVEARQIELPGLDTRGVSIPNFPIEPGIISARLTQPAGQPETGPAWQDFLAEDNVAFTINNPNTDRRILSISPGNFFLDQILSALPSTQAYRSLPLVNPQTEAIQFPLPEDEFDLYILDRALPTSPGIGVPQLPDGNLLLIDPPSNPLFSVTGEFSPIQMRVVEHALTEHLDWSSVHIKEARHVQVPVWAEVLVDSTNGPLVFVGEHQGRRIAVLTFDLHESDLPLQVAFPILFANLHDYLLPTQAIQIEGNLLPNENVQILIPPGIERIAIASPQDNVYNLQPSENGVLFSNTRELGVYAVNFLSPETQRVEYFAVNLFTPVESNILPAGHLQIGRSSILASSESKLGQLENWRWFTAVGLVILLVEWWFYHRSLIFKPFNWLKRS